MAQRALEREHQVERVERPEAQGKVTADHDVKEPELRSQPRQNPLLAPPKAARHIQPPQDGGTWVIREIFVLALDPGKAEIERVLVVVALVIPAPDAFDGGATDRGVGARDLRHAVDALAVVGAPAG
jgi:hypothetical protein